MSSQTSLGPGPDKARESYGIPLVDLREAILDELYPSPIQTLPPRDVVVLPSRANAEAHDPPGWTILTATEKPWHRNTMVVTVMRAHALLLHRETHEFGSCIRELLPMVDGAWYCLAIMPDRSFDIGFDGYDYRVEVDMNSVQYAPTSGRTVTVRYMGKGVYHVA